MNPSAPLPVPLEAEQIPELAKRDPTEHVDEVSLTPALRTEWGVLYNDDCLDFLPQVGTDTVDTVFADPPFNLGKIYGPKVDDALAEDEYLSWSKRWMDECIRVLKPGGSLFIYNVPRWNIPFGAHLMERGLMFRHWITVSMKASLPIQGRLYPAHYSLLYYSKGKPKTFQKIRTPIEQCRHCGGEIKDYGGHRGAMNPNGVNLTDVWTDIPPVRHRKFKHEKRVANQLSTKLLDRVIHLSTVEGDLVLDPFGGAGTTFAVAERHERYWLGSEIESCEAIEERLLSDEVEYHANGDFVERKPVQGG